MVFRNVRKILVIKLRHIGDVLITVPVFRALRENFPDASISALVNSGTEDVLKGNPLIDDVIVFERAIKGLPPLRRYGKELGFLRQIRAGGFDMTVDLTGGDRPAILSFISGARYRLGWRPRNGLPGKRRLYTHLSKPDRKIHTILQNLDIVRRHGIDTSDLSVDLFVPESDMRFVARIIAENGVGRDDVIVHVHPTSRWLFKCWNDKHMAEIIRWLLEEGVTVIVTSSPEKREMGKAARILSLAGPHRRLIDLCGKTTMKQLAAVASAARMFFGVDSAPMHVAAAVDTPVVALFGPSGAFNWGPWDNKESSKFKVQSPMSDNTTHNDNKESSKSGVQSSTILSPYSQRNGMQAFGIHTVIQRGWDCIPCGEDGCGGSKISKCLEDISVSEVKEVISEKLKGTRK